jgi:hypothetical protein
MSLFSNIIHKKAVRTQMLESVAGGLKEMNRKRTNTAQVVSTGGATANTFLAPWSGFVEELIISSPYATTSTGVGSSPTNSITVSVIDVTKSNAVLATFDTYLNGTELTANSGVKVDFNFGLSGGIVSTQFNSGDLLAVVTTMNGTGGNVSFSSGVTPLFLNIAFTSNDARYAA